MTQVTMTLKDFFATSGVHDQVYVPNGENSWHAEPAASWLSLYWDDEAQVILDEDGDPFFAEVGSVSVSIEHTSTGSNAYIV